MHRSLPPRSRLALLFAGLVWLSSTPPGLANTMQDWKLLEHRKEAGRSLSVYVERSPTPGRPAFRIETRFAATPAAAAAALMRDMSSESSLPQSHRRRVLERGDHHFVVHTHIDLPLMLSDRELAVRIQHSKDPATGIHRIDWREANDRLPAAVEKGVLRLEGTLGYWEFRPDGRAGTEATYVSQTELGGSIPAAIGQRFMKAEAVDAVVRLGELLAHGPETGVASGPPEPPR